MSRKAEDYHRVMYETFFDRFKEHADEKSGVLDPEVVVVEVQPQVSRFLRNKFGNDNEIATIAGIAFVDVLRTKDEEIKLSWREVGV